MQDAKCKSSITISKSNLFCIHFFTLWQMQTCKIFNRNLIYLLPLCTAFISLVVSKNRLVSQGQRKIYHPLRKIKWSLSKRIQLYSPLFPFEWEKVSKSYPTRLVESWEEFCTSSGVLHYNFTRLSATN